MGKSRSCTKELFLIIPFYDFIDGEMELVDELYSNYIEDIANIEWIKRFIITDYLTQLDNEELAKMFTDFKSRKTIEQEEKRKREREIEESIKHEDFDDEMPF